MGSLDNRVAIVTGAGRGLGREHALRLASEGADVVVNDLGGSRTGEGSDREPAQEVVDEIVAAGGRAVANTDNVADWEGAKRLIYQAVETFGDFHVLVNNAGILRDRLLVNMEDSEWESVIRVHLTGHFAPTRHAAKYWRDRSKAGHEINASLIHTSSTSGLLGNPGQSNYGAAKAGIAAFSSICAMELSRFGVRSNAITPAARTRLTEETPGVLDFMAPPTDPTKFDRWDPANVSPMVAYLATADCPFNGEVFHVEGDSVTRYQPHIFAERIRAGKRRWTVEELKVEAKALIPEVRRGGPSETQIR